MREPIVAVATPFGESAIGVVRLSGRDVLSIVQRFFRGRSPIKPRFAHYGTLVDEKQKPIDECVLIYFKSPHTYTGEDMVELSLHGNPLILRKVVRLFLENGCRLAEPGEFTKRAFLNGKMDLTQAEAVADLIGAKTELAYKSALRQLRGELSAEIIPLRENLLELAAYLEADIEFSEEDIPTLTPKQIVNTLDRILESIEELLKTAGTGRFLREGLKLAIVGRPNVGKSSLFNALLKKERSIVTDVEGTTRDYVEEVLNLGGIPIRLIDTAGIRKTANLVERLGVERTMEKIEEADVILFLVDGHEGLVEEDLKVYEKVKEKNTVVVINKIDLGEAHVPLEIFGTHPIIKVSARTGYGLKSLEEEILKKVGIANLEGLSVYISVRHEELLRKAKETIGKLKTLYREKEPSPEIAMLYIREASNCLGEIVGEVTTEDILGSIFSRFCIGK